MEYLDEQASDPGFLESWVDCVSQVLDCEGWGLKNRKGDCDKNLTGEFGLRFIKARDLVREPDMDTWHSIGDSLHFGANHTEYLDIVHSAAVNGQLKLPGYPYAPPYWIEKFRGYRYRQGPEWRAQSEKEGTKRSL